MTRPFSTFRLKIDRGDGRRRRLRGYPEKEPPQVLFGPRVVAEIGGALRRRAARVDQDGLAPYGQRRPRFCRHRALFTVVDHNDVWKGTAELFTGLILM